MKDCLTINQVNFYNLLLFLSYLRLLKNYILSYHTKTKIDQAGSFEPAQWAPKPPIQSIGRDLLIEELYVLAFMMDARKFPNLGTRNPDRSIPPNHLRWPQVGDHNW